MTTVRPLTLHSPSLTHSLFLCLSLSFTLLTPLETIKSPELIQNAFVVVPLCKWKLEPALRRLRKRFHHSHNAFPEFVKMLDDVSLTFFAMEVDGTPLSFGVGFRWPPPPLSLDVGFNFVSIGFWLPERLQTIGTRDRGFNYLLKAVVSDLGSRYKNVHSVKVEISKSYEKPNGACFLKPRWFIVLKLKVFWH